MLTSFFDLDKVLDIIYPPTCVGCDVDGFWLCHACARSIRFHADIQSHLVVLGYYANPVLRRLLTCFKYQAASCLTDSLRALICQYRFVRGVPWPWAHESELTVCAIPGDSQRIKTRGLDHAHLLADIVHTELVPWGTRSNLLRRTKKIHQNALLPTNQARSINVRGAFACTQSVKSAVLLVDDVYTTGATWQEAAKVLRAGGADEVYGFVMAVG